MNAVSIKRLVQQTTGVKVTDATAEATLIQSRHRIPEVPLTADQLLVLQVPTPEPLRDVEASEAKTRILHSEEDYSGAWLQLFEQVMKYGRTATGADHPVFVHNRYVMAPSPIPRFDNAKLHQSEALILFGAGREKKSMRCRHIPMFVPWRLRITLLQQNHLMGSAASFVAQTMSF